MSIVAVFGGSHVFRWRRAVPALGLAACIACWATPAWSIPRQWVGGDGNWSNDVKWNPLGVPLSADTAVIGQLSLRLR